MKNKPSIKKIWEKLKTPSPNNYSAIQFHNSNLWVIKNSNNSFGIILSEVTDMIKKKYDNIIIERKGKFKSDQTVLKNCILIQNNHTITPKSLCDAINSQLRQQAVKDFYEINDLKKVLNEIYRITKSTSEQLNEVVGVWGELHIINEFLGKTNNDNGRKHLIDSWESHEGRTVVDFNLSIIKTMIEIKTTTNESRVHRINSIKQIHHSSGWKGYLASICVFIDDNRGKTCLDLINEIKQKINPILFETFIKRTKVRGESLCNNNHYKILENPNKLTSFFEFDDIPKPSFGNGVENVSWDTTLENINALSNQATNRLFESL